MPDRYRNLTHGTAASDSAGRALLRGWLAVALLLALGLTGCHKKKPRTTRSPQAHAAIPAPVGSIEEGLASWYGPPYHGRQAADGEIYDMEKMTAAHRTLPFQTWVRVTNRQNGLTVDVRITDRGPFVEGRIIDLSKAAARRIQLLGPGVSPVRLEVINPPSQVLASAPIRSGNSACAGRRGARTRSSFRDAPACAAREYFRAGSNRAAADRSSHSTRCAIAARYH